jgi:DNA helicase-2/ATP-dependent DNA helicase PcrA
VTDHLAGRTAPGPALSGEPTVDRWNDAPNAGATWTAARIAEALGQPPPTAEQTEVIEAPLTPMLVVAGAGSGKTETMAARVVHLVANRLVAPGEILGLTFTRKAAAELSGRIRVRLRALARAGVEGGDTVEDRPRIATYNSYASAIVRDHALRIGVDPDATLIGDAGRYQLAEQVVAAWHGDIDTPLAPTTIIDAVAALSAELSEHGLEPGQAAAAMERIAGALLDKAAAGRSQRPMAQTLKVTESLGTRAQLMDLVDAFAARKQRSGVVDFGDQVRLAATIAAAVPEVGEAERSRYRVVLLDEYQDTSIAQVQMLRALFATGHPVTAVGDPNQAIYGWRGAAAGTLFAFPEAFPEAGGDNARIAHLSTAWRNDTAILTAANRTAGPLRELASAGGAVGRLQGRPGAGPGRAVAVFCETAQEEAARIAGLLAEHWHPEHASAAVLCRKRAQFPVIEAALRAAGLPCQVVGLAGLLSTPEVADIRAALQVAHDPSRGDAMMRLLTGPSVNLGAADLYALSRWARSQASAWVARSDDDDPDEAPVVLEAAEQASLVEAVDVLPPPAWRTGDDRSLSEGARRRLGRLAAQIRQIRSLTYLSMPELVTATETILDLDIEVLASVPGSVGHARRHLDAFTSAAASFAGDSDAPTLGAFLTYLDVAEDEERGLEVVEAEPDPTAIQIMTVHAAKGLEWDTVVVAGMNEGSFPSIPSRNGWLTAVASLPYELRGDADWLPELDIEGATTHKDMDLALGEFREAEGDRLLAEERRLAYVALTRAKRTLMLSGSFWSGDRKTPTAPSVFLTELVAGGFIETGADWPTVSKHETNPGAGAQTQAYWPEQRDPSAAIAGRWEEIWAGAAAEAAGEPDAPVTASGAAWWRDARLLLAERGAAAHTQVPPPEHLSASAVVGLASDAEEFVRYRRRPIPRRPSVAARRGTRFHAWVEQYFGASSLIEMDALPGADDDAAGSERALAELQQAFLGSPWAARTPVAVEVDIETPVAGITIRCRIDAVFSDGDGVHIVDWKTGSAPRSPEALRARQMQLALYRIAWSRLHGMPLERVRASFHYVAESVTVSGDDIAEADVAEVLAQVGPETMLAARPRARIDRSDRPGAGVEIVADTLW